MNINKKEALHYSFLAVNDCDQLKFEIMQKVTKSIAENGREYHPNSWTAHALNFIRCFQGDSFKPYFQIFSLDGNNKLPFLSFSTLPGVNCPGAGACLSEGFCYSFKAWRYPAAFFRQLQNTILERQFPGIIKKEFERVMDQPKFKNRRVDFRLYVDGDFPNLDIMHFWFSLLGKHSRVAAYGYSKSLHLFKEYLKLYKVPENYALNASGGGKFDELMRDLKKEDFYRGTFSSYQLTNGSKKAIDLTKEDKKEIRKSFKNKVFICPGPCGDCTSIGHACGNLDTFKNVDIITPIH